MSIFYITFSKFIFSSFASKEKWSTSKTLVSSFLFLFLRWKRKRNASKEKENTRPKWTSHQKLRFRTFLLLLFEQAALRYYSSAWKISWTNVNEMYIHLIKKRCVATQYLIAVFFSFGSFFSSLMQKKRKWTKKRLYKNNSNCHYF